MVLKKLLALLCALMLVLSLPAAQAEAGEANSAVITEFSQIPDSLFYKGGVVLRGQLKDAQTSGSLLEMAYVTTTTPYLLLDVPTSWDVAITGGEAPYECQVIVAYQEFYKDEFDDAWSVQDWFMLNGGSFDYTFAVEGRYFFEFRVMDESGQFFSFQTRIYETYTHADENMATTVAGKVNSIIEEYITPDMSGYSRAKVLHDWLIHNANYDYTYTNYDASGVLLYGTGVCDSYARAYLMLCTAAGLECMYVSGSAGSADADPASWGDHGWNLVRLGDSWYHVDCTWDDPGQGGYERHTYFLIDDEAMARDHRWNRPEDIFDSNGYIPPAAEGGEYEVSDEETTDFDFTFATWAEFFSRVDQMVAKGQRQARIAGLYTGDLSSSEMYAQMAEWSGSKTQELYNRGLITGASRQHDGMLFFYNVYWIDPTSYIRIEEETLRLSIGEEADIVPSEYSGNAAAFMWQSSDPDVVSVAAPADGTGAPMATVTGQAAGQAVITVTSADGDVDSLTITVLPAYQPDFALSATANDAGVFLSWNAIPGVTEYHIVRVFEHAETVLATTADHDIQLSSTLLPDDVQQMVYIKGLRVVGGEAALVYTSEPVTYGSLKLTFTSLLPADATAIGEEAFAGDCSLVSVKLQDRLMTIGDGAFRDCTSLVSVSIPVSVTSIGKGAFENCPLKYAEVSPGSYAERWLLEHYPEIQFAYR